jgi:hypothetical protein
MSDMEKGKFLRLGKRMAWAEDPEQRRFARQLVLDGNGPKKVAEALNKRFGLSINGNSLGGFIHAKKGNQDGPTFFLKLLSDGEEVPVRAAKKAAPPTQDRRVSRNNEVRVPPPPLDISPAETPEYDAAPNAEFNYDEYLKMSLKEDRHAPGNGPLRLKAPAKRGK